MTAARTGNAVSFILAFHNHQPVGNFDNVFQEALEKCYEPFLAFLEKHPKFRVSLHYSGCLMDWFEAHRPSFLNRLSRLVDRGQVELIGGGYYEPIISIIPERDAIGQLVRMNHYLKKRFKTTPKGFWLTERVWEPKMPRIAGEAGLIYTVVDDTHFSMAGIPQEKIRDFYVTEEEGALLYIFPILKELRYLIPFKEPDEVMLFLKNKAAGEDIVITFADDGEKLGLWPGTYQWVYREGWLERFAQTLEENQSWIQLKTFSEVLKEKKATDNVYLPTASYDEMMEWSLSLEKGKNFQELRRHLESSGFWQQTASFLQSGYFKNFLVKYPEAAHMRNRMAYASEKVCLMKNPRLKQAAQTALWKGECNCPYWHGVFGGLYLHHLRRATYENLILADELAASADGSLKKAAHDLSFEEIDFNRDGEKELVCENTSLKLFVEPRKGGRILELDLKPLRMNVLDTMTRREEAYHGNIPMRAKEGGDKSSSIHNLVRTVSAETMERIAFDSYDRASFLDRFFPSDFNPGSCQKGRLAPLADTLRTPYAVRIKKTPKFLSTALQSDITFLTGDNIRLEKKIILEQGSDILSIEITLVHTRGKDLSFLYGQEWNLTFYDGRRNEAGVHGADIQDGWSRAHLRIESPAPFDYWQYPIETLAQTEKDFQLMHQGLCIFPHWKVTLPAGDRWRTQFQLHFTDAGSRGR